MKLPDMPSLSDRLQYIRKHHRLSQTELAHKAGTSQQAIQQAEKGKARQPRYLPQLAKSLDIPLDWMLVGVVEEDNKGIASKQKVKEKNQGGGLSETEILSQFYGMPRKDQTLIYELMKSRKKS